MTATMQNRLAQLESASPAKSRAYIAMEPPPGPPLGVPTPATVAKSASSDEVFNSSIPDVAPPMVADNDYR